MGLAAALGRDHQAEWPRVVDRFVVELPAGAFSYLETGQGDPVVFLHALGRSGSDWLAVLEALKDEYRCLAVDQRGHGESVRLDQYTFELMEQDFRDFVDSLGLERFVLVAHSMGGTVGWLFAEKTPDRLSALIIEDTPVPIDRHTYEEIAESPPEPVSYDWEARRQLFRQLNSPNPTWWTSLSRITVPTLVIDGSGFEESRDIARILPRGELITIDVGHWVHEAAPDAFVQWVRDFLNRSIID